MLGLRGPPTCVGHHETSDIVQDDMSREIPNLANGELQNPAPRRRGAVHARTHGGRLTLRLDNGMRESSTDERNTRLELGDPVVDRSIVDPDPDPVPCKTARPRVVRIHPFQDRLEAQSLDRLRTRS